MINFRIQSLTVLFLATLAYANQDISYGLRFPTYVNNGPTGNTGTGGGYSSGQSASNAGMTARGRIVGNSILDLDDTSDLELEHDHNADLNFAQRPTNFPLVTKPTMTGPSVSPGHMLQTENSVTPMSMTTRPHSVRPTMPSGSGPSSIMTDRTVHRYVSVHVPPPEPMVQSRLRSLPTPKPETHYQIMFIKAPSVSPQELQEIQLPPPPRMKTMVYVLMRKPEMNDFIKLSQPPKVMPPSKPEVFFIQYKGQKEQLMQSGSGMPTVASSTSGKSESTPKQRTTTTTNKPPSTKSPQMMQNLEGYGNEEIADSDFSHDGFIPNEFPPNAYHHQQQQQHQQQRLVTNHQPKQRPGFAYSPAASHYRIVS